MPEESNSPMRGGKERIALDRRGGPWQVRASPRHGSYVFLFLQENRPETNLTADMLEDTEDKQLLEACRMIRKKWRKGQEDPGERPGVHGESKETILHLMVSATCSSLMAEPTAPAALATWGSLTETIVPRSSPSPQRRP